MSGDLAGQIATWERAASGWEKWREPIWAATAHVGVHLIDAVDPRPGETVLELAAGMGDTGFVAAQRVAPGGLVISSDFSPAMVDGARRRAAELGAAGIEFRVLDAQALDLEDASVDAVVCRWGYMLMPDPSAALRETRRVLRPDGRLAFTVWGPPDENPWASIPAGVLVDAGRMDPPRPDVPGIFTLSDPARIEALVTAAGFVTPSVVAVRMQWPFDSFDDYWTFVLEKVGAVAAVIEQLPGGEQDAVRASVRDALGSRADGAFVLAGLCLNVSTRVPTR